MTIKRITYFKIIVVGFSILITLFLLDTFLNVNKDVTAKNNYNHFNDSINNANHEFALKNPYGFTDIERKKEKPDSIFRIAVIGDSYIWGDGLPYEKVWSHKLARKISEKYKNIEVLSWGKNGWSTLDEYNFFIENGYKYHINLMLFGFVHNDTDMGDFKHLNPLWYKRLGFMYKIMPRLTGAVLDYIYNGSYARWMKKLYTEENLCKYQTLLFKIKTLERKHHLQTAFILTPSDLNDEYKVLFPKIDTLLSNAHLDYIDLFPTMQEKLADLPPDSFKANPANAHPGNIVTEFYANQVMTYIAQKKYIDSSFKK